MNISSIIQFLDDLKINNNREWFAENKARYDEVRIDFEKISKQLIAKLAEFDDEIKRVEAKDCIFRIYRDTRFSKDKTPYKTHFGVFIAADGGRKSQRAGYYLHLDPAGSFLACGVWCPEPELLKALRQSVYDNIDELNDIRNESEFSRYYSRFFEEDKLKTVPRGFPKDFPDAELLKLKHYLVEYSLTENDLSEGDFVEKVAGIMKCAFPLNRFLNYTVDEIKA